MSMYGDGGFFFLQPVNNPKQVVSSYGDGGFYFLQQMTSPQQVVSSYGAFHLDRGLGYGEAPVSYVKSADAKCKAKLTQWEALKKNENSLTKGVRVQLEKELIESGCLQKTGGGSKKRPGQGENPEVPEDKEEVNLEIDEEESFWDQYKTYIIAGSALAALGLGYVAYRSMK